MNRPTKVSLVSSIFVITGLCGSLSQAAPEVKNNAEHYANITKTINRQSIASTISYNYNFSSIASEMSFGNKNFTLPSSAKVSRKPMLGIQVADFAHVTPDRFEKKNVIFEFAAKFNDKLQQILTVFNFSSTQVMQSQESKSNKKRKVHLTSNIGNCIVSKK